MSGHTLERILHVDDEADIREIVRVSLEAIGGFRVRSCASGAQAVASAPEFNPDLLLLDVMMPGMSGPETLAALRGGPAAVSAPAVFMTARDDAAPWRALGAVATIAKPFDPLRLPARLGEIWERRARG